MTREEVVEYNEEALLLGEEFDPAIIGVAERINLGPVVAYDADKVIDILAKTMQVDEGDLEKGQTIEEKQLELAIEYFDYNIKGAWVGENTPVFISKGKY